VAGRKFPKKPVIERTSPSHFNIGVTDFNASAPLLGRQESPSAWGDRFWIAEEASCKGELDALVAELARRARVGAHGAIDALLEDLRASGHDMRLLYRDLIEPAARQLGDWWINDKAYGFEVTLALTHLHRSVRRLGAGVPTPTVPPTEQLRYVLIASHPAECSIIGATLAGDVFRSAGWFVQVEFPHDDDDLLDAIRLARYDILVILLGDLYCHADRFDAIAACIAAARMSSQNRSIAVLVGGRVVLDQPCAVATLLGAEAAFTTAADALEKACDLLGVCRHRVAWRLLNRSRQTAAPEDLPF
jgi:MerR family transcriptional regulator, light-induced transcriptional regulator